MYVPSIFSIGLLAMISVFPRPLLTNQPSGPGSGFAVVELYTSEGCSSCPAADDVVARLAKENQRNIYVLAFHVDYWNNLGWKDAFSDPAFSRRQQEYAAVFRQNSIYTPQVVVNGKIQFVGSDEGKLRKTLEGELKNSSGLVIDAGAKIDNPKQVRVTYKLNPERDQLLRIVLVQLQAATAVKKGENQGRYLQHVNLVRDFKTVTVGKGKNNTGFVILNFPDGLSPASCKVILFAQDKSSLAVTGATGVGLN